MSGHMFFGGDYLGFDDALFAAARLLEIVSRQPFGLAPLLADLPRTIATPEIRVECADEEKFAHRRAGRGSLRREVPGQHHRRGPDHLSHGLGTAPRLEYPADPRAAVRGHRTPQSLDAARSEVVGWLAGQGVRA